MDKDLSMRWQSPIGVGEIVLVSYGLPGGRDETLTDYEEQRDIDLNKYHRSYNSTLWQKIYVEEADSKEYELRSIETIFVSGSYGLGYRLLASLTGETPKIEWKFNRTQVEDGGNVLNADEFPKLTIEDADYDNPKITFWLPQSQVLEIDTKYKKPGDDREIEEGKTILGTTPEIEYDDSSILEDGKERINHPLLTFTLPELWKLDYSIIRQDASVPLDVKLELQDDKQTQKLIFNIPDPYEIRLGQFNTSLPGSEPEISLIPMVEDEETGMLKAAEYYEEQDEYEPYTILHLNITLPRGQSLDNIPDVEVINPSDSPIVEINDNPLEIVEGSLTRKDKPKLKFYLPDSAKFYFGDLLGKSADKIYRIGEVYEDYQVGDFYINKDTGFIYKITEITQVPPITSFEYQACLAGKEPDVQTEESSSYIKLEDGTFEKNTVKVETSFTDEIEKTGAIHKFVFPIIPEILATYTSVGAADAANVEKIIVDENNINFHFSLPNGSRWFVGTEINDNFLTKQIEGAKNGDFYLYAPIDQTDEFRGNIYLFNGTIWIKTNTNIEGPVGDALNIVATYNITGTNDENTLENISRLLESETYYGGQPNSDELIAVNYTNIEDLAQSSYWYYCLNGNWDRALLTGGVASLISNIYIAEGHESRTYSISYLNSLIQNSEFTNNISEKNRKTYSAELIDAKHKKLVDDIDKKISENKKQIQTNEKHIEFNNKQIEQNIKDIQAINDNLASNIEAYFTWQEISSLIPQQTNE